MSAVPWHQFQNAETLQQADLLIRLENMELTERRQEQLSGERREGEIKERGEREKQYSQQKLVDKLILKGQ